MSKFKIVLTNPAVCATLSYQSYSQWRTDCVTRIFEIDYTGTNAIVVRYPHTQEYTYSVGGVRHTGQYTVYSYYLIGKNVTVNSFKLKPHQQRSNTYGINSSSFDYNAISAAGKQQAQNNIVFDYNWLTDTSDYTELALNRTDYQILSSLIPVDTLQSIPERFTTSGRNCVFGIPIRLFSTNTYAETPAIWYALNQTYQSSYVLRDYTSDTTYDEYSFKASPLEQIPPIARDLRYLADTSATNGVIVDNFLFERNGNVKYDLSLSPEQNYITEWDLIQKSAQRYFDKGKPFDIFASIVSTSSTSGIFWNPTHYNQTYNSSIRNAYTPPAQFGTMDSLGAGFPSFSFGSPYIPYENVLFIDIPVSDLIDESNNYVQTGNLPSDAIFVETDDDGVPKQWKNTDPDPEGEDGTQSISVDDMELPSPTRGALTAGACRYYLMTKEAMETFLHWFWYENHGLEDVFDNFWSNMYGNLKETILSYQYFPCTTSALGTISSTQENILLGRLVSTQTASRLNGLPSTILLGSINIKNAYKHFNTFVDWEGYTNFQIYLPFAGIVKLPTKSVQNAVLKVYYCVDVGTGQMNYIIKSYPNGGENGFVVLETTTPIGETIPISLMDDMENKTKLAQTAVQVVGSTIGLAASVATGNIAGAAIATGGLVSGATNASNAANPNIMIRTAEHSGQRMISGVGQIANEAMQYQSDTPSAVGQITGLMGKWSPLKCYLIIDYPTVDNAGGGYNRHVGYLNYKPYKLSSLSGFTTCVKPQIDFTNTAPLLKEIEELYQLMESGIIL